MKKWFKKFILNRPNNKYTLNKKEGTTVSFETLVQLQYQTHGLYASSTKQVATHRGGNYQAYAKGRGINFEEVRTYQPGDDIRLMDWRITARTGKPHTKVFHEERERPLFILVNQGASMFFGTKVAFKSVIAAKVAALLAWSAAQNGDRVGGMIYNSELMQVLKPKSRTAGVLPFLKNLSKASQLPPRLSYSQNGLEQALAKLQMIIKPGSMVIILSDFSELNPINEKQLGLLSKHCEIMMGIIYDPLENTPPPANYYTITDGTNLATINTHNPNFCHHYSDPFLQRLALIKKITRHYPISTFYLKTSEPITNVLQKCLWRKH